MESRADMLARHQRELAELDSRWWEEWFVVNPQQSFMDSKMGTHEWIVNTLPTIIRKREKIGVKITMLEHMKSVVEYEEGMIYYRNLMAKEHYDFIVKLAGRTLAPGEKVEI